MARSSGGDEVEGLDEEFLFHLNRGSELITRGEAEPARSALERALSLRPKDAKVLGLLGQAYYRLSRFGDAARVWGRLVDDNPVEPAARVNLGLAHLKAKAYPDAIKQLEIAVDLNPDHKKAMGYLGLALLESGSIARAREWFRKAGSDQMAARCDEILAGGGRAEPSADATEAPAHAEAEAAPEPPPAPEPLRTPAPGHVPAYRGGPAGTALAAWAAARVVAPASGETFSLSGDVLAVTVRGEVRVRLDGVFATRGRVSIAGELKRFRGRATEKPFGDGATRMHTVTGDGTLLYAARRRRFTALDLGADAAYLREEAVFGFEEGIAFENGRVPSSAAELNLVHLRGRGRFLLVTRGEPVAVDVTADAPIRLPLEALVGWVGALTPRITGLVDDGGAVAVELAGDGRVLADPGPASEG